MLGGGHPSRDAVAGVLLAGTRSRALDGCGLPGSSGGQPSSAPCLALLRVGFTEPRRSPGALVVSYTTVSPLPGPVARPGRSVLCGTVPRVTPGGRYPPPCPVESGLSSAGGEPPDAAACPARPRDQ